jgi:hypothetical protein
VPPAPPSRRRLPVPWPRPVPSLLRLTILRFSSIGASAR